MRMALPDLQRAPAPLTDGDYGEIDIKGSIHDESIDGLLAAFTALAEAMALPVRSSLNGLTAFGPDVHGAVPPSRA